MADFGVLGAAIQAQEFEAVWTIRGDSVLPCRGPLWAPDAYVDSDGRDCLSGAGWSFVSGGWTGQYGYSGPVMHPSEQVGEGIAVSLSELSVDYLAFALVVVEDLDDEENPAGWAVVGYSGADGRICRHSWVAGMMCVADEDLDAVSQVRPVECERCEVVYSPELAR